LTRCPVSEVVNERVLTVEYPTDLGLDVVEDRVLLVSDGGPVSSEDCNFWYELRGVGRVPLMKLVALSRFEMGNLFRSTKTIRVEIGEDIGILTRAISNGFTQNEVAEGERGQRDYDPVGFKWLEGDNMPGSCSSESSSEVEEFQPSTFESISSLNTSSSLSVIPFIASVTGLNGVITLGYVSIVNFHEH
jgi:hypothetical protein